MMGDDCDLWLVGESTTVTPSSADPSSEDDVTAHCLCGIVSTGQFINDWPWKVLLVNAALRHVRVSALGNESRTVGGSRSGATHVLAPAR